MKFAIIGPGALGCLLTALLAESGQEVVLLDHRAERAHFISDRGIHVESESGERRVKVKVTDEPKQAADADLVFVCVKAYSTRDAIAPVATLLGKNARVLTLQNGLGNVEALADAVGRNRVWGGTTAQGATELGLGQIRHGGRGDTAIAPAKSGADKDRLDEVASILNSAKVPTHVEADVNSLIWSKLIVNVGINPLTALTRLRNGQLLEHLGTQNIMETAVAEASAVAKALKVKLLYPDSLERVREVARVTAPNVASMLQDILAMRRTEIDHINGAVTDYGAKLGIPTPVNQTLTDLIKTIQASYGDRV